MNPVSAPRSFWETRIVMGRVPYMRKRRADSMSLRCSSVEASGQSNARIVASSCWSERFACLTLMVNACSTSCLMSGVGFCERVVEKPHFSASQLIGA